MKANTQVTDSCVQSEPDFHSLYRGNIDKYDMHCISGWVHAITDIHRALSVTFLINGQKIQSAKADIYRSDLELSNIGFGRCAFSIDLPQIFHAAGNDLVDCELEVHGGDVTCVMARGMFGVAPIDLEVVQRLDAEFPSNDHIEHNLNQENETSMSSSDSTASVHSAGLTANNAYSALRDISNESGEIESASQIASDIHDDGADESSAHEENESANELFDQPAESVQENDVEPGSEPEAHRLESDLNQVTVSIENEFTTNTDHESIAHEPDNRARFHECFIGNVEVIGGNRISGWVVDKQNNANRVAVIFMLNGKCVARIIANHDRPDILAAGHGTSNCGFQIDLANHGFSETELFGAELVLEVVSGDRTGVMYASHLPSAFGSLPDACKRQLISAFEPYLQSVPNLNKPPKNQKALVQNSDVSTITEQLYRNEKGPFIQPVNNDIPQLSPYVVFTRDRLNQHKTFDFETDPRKAVDLLMWYVEGYGGMRKPYKIPLSNEEIQYCNELVVFPNAHFSFSRLHYFMLLKNKPDLNILGVLNHEDAYRTEVFEWVEDTCKKLNVIDVCVPREYVDVLKSVRFESKDYKFPLNGFFEKKLEADSALSCFDSTDALQRGCLYTLFVIDGLKNLNNIRFISEGVKRQLLDNDQFLKMLSQDVLEPFYSVSLDIDEFKNALVSKLTLAGVDFQSGEFLSRTVHGDRHAFANPNSVDIDNELYDVQLIGPLEKASGLGQAARLSASVLKRFAYNYNLVNFDLDNPAPEGFSTKVVSGKLGKASVNLIHLNAESIPFVMAYCPDVFSDSYNIGYFFWELDTPARCHKLAMDMLDEIWVCTEYGVTQYQDYCDIPVVNVGMTFEENYVPSKADCKTYLRNEFGISTDTTVFLATFDSFSFVQRKNPLAAIKAFKACFRNDENVQLLIKTQNKTFVGDPNQLNIWRAIEFEIGGDKRIKLINRTFGYDELLKFKRAADCYVSLHRSEGWGFGMIEAMTLGVPVIATNYSGNLEFCHSDNCWLIDYTETYLSESDYIFVVPGQKWAEPHISHAAQAMRECFENREIREQKQNAAESYVRERFSNSTISDRYKQRLDLIIENL